METVFYGVKRDHYDKLIGIREFLEQLAQYFFNNPFSTGTGTPSNSIPPLGEDDGGDTVSTCCALHFSVYIYPSAEASTISDITQYSASSISIRNQYTAEREEAIEEGIFNRIHRCYCLVRLPNLNICLEISL